MSSIQKAESGIGFFSPVSDKLAVRISGYSSERA
jgi:hypothetical protein